MRSGCFGAKIRESVKVCCASGFWFGSQLGNLSDSNLYKISNSLTKMKWNLAVKINANHGVQQEISVSIKVSKKIVPFQQEFSI